MVAPIPAVLILVLAGLPVAWRSCQVVGLALLLSALVLLTLARWQLGNAFSIEPRATALVTHGLYARIRNPVYLFGTALIAGLLLYLNRPGFLALLLPVVVLQVVRARREAIVLEKAFGDAYVEYRSQTWF